MNKTLIKVAAFVLLFSGLSFLVSCEVDPPVTFDETLLVGRWQEGTVYEYYSADSTGYTWDTADDVTEEEAQDFTWSVDGDQLLQIHIMEIGGSIPKAYTLTKLDETYLTYEDDYGTVHSFTRVQ